VAAGVDHQSPDDEILDRLIAAADLDGLRRLIDDRCTADDWGGVLHVRDRARWAVTTGLELWPAATMAEHRLALLAPDEWAARVLDDDSGPVALGPLTEVVAQNHSWEGLSRLLVLDARAGLFAHERALRGEAIDTEDLPNVLDMPYELEPWEPRYTLPVYTADGATFLAPRLPTSFVDVEVDRGPLVPDDDVDAAFRQLVEPWTAESNGRASVVCVDGPITDAVGALGVTSARIADLTASEALQWLAWAGSSGGACGRRRGGARGRFGAWWLIAALGGATGEWPLSPHAIGELAEELHWYWWDDGAPASEWQLRLVVTLPAEGLSWAFSAHDDT
jgi:hypothetical protein